MEDITMNFKKGSPESAGIPSGCLLHFLDRLQKKQVPMLSIRLFFSDFDAKKSHSLMLISSQRRKVNSSCESIVSISTICGVLSPVYVKRAFNRVLRISVSKNRNNWNGSERSSMFSWWIRLKITKIRRSA